MDSISINNRSNETSTRATMAYGVGVRLTIFIIIGVVTYFSFAQGITLFSWHPPLMLIGVSRFVFINTCVCKQIVVLWSMRGISI